MFRELVRVMATFWTSWLVATNMTPFAMTFHNRFQDARNIVSRRKTVATVSRLVLPPVGFSMQLLDQGHHPYISTGFGGKHFYSLVYIYIYIYIYTREE